MQVAIRVIRAKIVIRVKIVIRAKIVMMDLI